MGEIARGFDHRPWLSGTGGRHERWSGLFTARRARPTGSSQREPLALASRGRFRPTISNSVTTYAVRAAVKHHPRRRLCRERPCQKTIDQEERHDRTHPPQPAHGTVATTAAAVVPLATSFPARAAAPPAGTQAPGWYRYKVGSFEITVVTDGVNRFKLPDNIVANAKREDVNAALAAAHLQPDIFVTPYN